MPSFSQNVSLSITGICSFCYEDWICKKVNKYWTKYFKCNRFLHLEGWERCALRPSKLRGALKVGRSVWQEEIVSVGEKVVVSASWNDIRQKNRTRCAEKAQTTVWVMSLSGRLMDPVLLQASSHPYITQSYSEVVAVRKHNTPPLQIPQQQLPHQIASSGAVPDHSNFGGGYCWKQEWESFFSFFSCGIFSWS